MRNFFLMILFLFIILNIGIASNYISYNSLNKIIIINQKGIVQKILILPIKKINDYSLYNNWIVYTGGDNSIHLFNISHEKEFQILKGPYLYKNRDDWGYEIYRNLDFCEKNNSIVFTIIPKFERTPYCIKKTVSNLYYRFQIDLSDIGLINLKNMKFMNITKNNKGFNSFPYISKNIVVFQKMGTIILFDLRTNKRHNLLKKYKSFFNTHKSLNFCLIKSVDDVIVFSIYNRKYTEIEKIVSYSISKKKFYLLWDNRNKENIKINWVNLHDILKDKNELLILENNYGIYIYNYKTSLKKLVKMVKTKRIQFIDKQFNYTQ